MKHFLFVLALLLSFSASLFAQAQISYGIKAGLHLSQVDETLEIPNPSGEFVESYNGLTVLKPQLGLWLSIPLSKRFYLQPELLWTQKQWKPEGVPAATRNPLNFDYLSLPLALGYTAGNWQVTLGPEITFLVDQRFSEQPAIGPDDNPFIPENELGIAVNLGLQYHLQKWVIGVRANRDLTEFVSFDFTDINGESFGGNWFYHQGMTLWAGYALSR
jgi:hypothetical protein